MTYLGKHLGLWPLSTYFVLLFCLIFLGACSRSNKLEVNEATYEKIKIGTSVERLKSMLGEGELMSEDQTLDLFGELESERFEAAKDGKASLPEGMMWKKGDFSLTVLLVDGEVVAKAEEGKLHGKGDVGTQITK